MTGEATVAAGGRGVGGEQLLAAAGVPYALDLSSGRFTPRGGRLDLLGLPAEGGAWGALVHPLDRDRVDAGLRALAAGPPDGALDLEHRLEVSGRPVAVRNLARRTGGAAVAGVLLPAAPAAGAAAPPRAEPGLLERGVDALPLPLLVKDEAQRVLLVNQALCDLNGQPRERLLGRGFEALLGRDALAAFDAPDLEALASDRPVAATVQLRDPAGVVKDLAIIKAPFRDEAGRRLVIGVAHDVSLRSRLEQERERGREFLAQILDTVADPIFVKDERHRWVAVNQAFVELMGHPREVIVGRSDFDFFPRAEAEVFWAKDEQVLRTGELNENEELLTDARGRQHSIVTKKQAFTGSDGRRVLVGVIRDITDRRAADQALRESEERFRTIFDQGPLGMAVLDLELRLRSVNGMLCRMLDAHDSQLLGRSLLDLTHPDDRTRGGDTAEHLLSGELSFRKSERRLLRRDGDVLWASLTLSVICDADGEPLHFLAMVEDVSERRRAEAALLAARDAALRSAQAKSRFLANVSHEIRTPLNAVIGMTGLLLDGALDAEQRESLELIRSSGDALLTLLNDILDFSKLESDRMELERRPLELRACIEDSLDLVAPRAAEKGLELTHLPDLGVPLWLSGDSTRLRQVLVNLLSNAVKFTERGEVRLEVTSRLLDGFGAPAGGDHELRFSVIDTGIGIPTERLDRLFQSFSQVDVSTTRQFGGTGLGLAISRSLVERMGGRMWVESAPGGGSTFSFTVVAPPAPAPPGAPAEEAPALAGRRLLVVDDVASVRQLVARVAGAWGMTVRTTTTRAEAVALVSAGEAFVAALIDRDLGPGQSASDLALELRGLPGAPPLVLMTPMGRAGSRRLHGLFQAQLTKPLKLDALRGLLVKLAAGAPGPVADDPRRDRARLAQRAPLRVLVVDDNVVNLRVAQRLLERMGYRADLVGSGPEALAAVLRQRYDVVLLDVQMPDMDGFEVARRVRAFAAGGRARPRLVALTADVMHGDRERCLAAGMDDFVSKPVHVQELEAALLRAAAGAPPERTPPESTPPESTPAESTPPAEAAAPTATAAAAPAAAAPAAAAATPSWPHGAAIVDEAVVRGLYALSDEGGDGPVAELYALLLREAPGQLAGMRAALAAGDLAELVRRAHGLRGGSANLGARRLADAAGRVEDTARLGPREPLPALLDAVAVALERTREAAAARFPGVDLRADTPPGAPPGAAGASGGAPAPPLA